MPLLTSADRHCQWCPIALMYGLPGVRCSLERDRRGWCAVSEEGREPHDHVVVAEPIRDIYLHVLLELLHKDDSNQSAMSVTLQVGGALVTGELISRGRWEDEFRAWLATIDGSADVLTAMLDVVNSEIQDADEPAPLNFLHLRDAKFITNYRGTLEGTEAMGPGRPLWRARIVDVQGWSLGRPE